MVKYSDHGLDRTFAALSDPTRRAMLARLGEVDSMGVGELAEPFDMSLPAALKHVNVLAGAGLVVRAKRGRTVYCRLQAEPMRAALEWLETYERFWSERLDALARYVEDETCPTPASRASRSAGTSTRPSSASTRRGRKGRR